MQALIALWTGSGRASITLMFVLAVLLLGLAAGCWAEAAHMPNVVSPTPGQATSPPIDAANGGGGIVATVPAECARVGGLRC